MKLSLYVTLPHKLLEDGELAGVIREGCVVEFCRLTRVVFLRIRGWVDGIRICENLLDS